MVEVLGVFERLDTLVAADAPRVSALVDRGQGLIDRVQQSEAGWLVAVRLVAQSLGLEPEQVTVSRLRAEVDRATAAALRAAQVGPLTRIERLAGESRRGARLLGGIRRRPPGHCSICCSPLSCPPATPATDTR